MIASILDWQGPLGAKGSYLVQLAFVSRQAEEYWMSAKQFERLANDFSLTPKGHSCRQASVYGVFDGRRYVWSGVRSVDRNDLSYLRERFDVVVPLRGHGIIDVIELDLSQPVEVNPELLDQ